jgi:hypothetical protein
MPATEPDQRRRRVGSDAPRQARTPACDAGPCPPYTAGPRCLWDQPRGGWMPIRNCCLLSTRALPPAASDASRCDHTVGSPADLVEQCDFSKKLPWVPKTSYLVTPAYARHNGDQRLEPTVPAPAVNRAFTCGYCTNPQVSGPSASMPNSGGPQRFPSGLGVLPHDTPRCVR